MNLPNEGSKTSANSIIPTDTLDETSLRFVVGAQNDLVKREGRDGHRAEYVDIRDHGTFIQGDHYAIHQNIQLPSMNSNENRTPATLNLQYLITWLRPNEDYSTSHEFLMEKEILPEAGQWIHQERAFEDWFKKQGSKLWLHGKVGSGKSILCSRIVQSLLEQTFEEKSAPSSLTMYFYFSSNRSETQNLKQLLISLIFQFCISQGVPTQLQALYTKHRKHNSKRLIVPTPYSSELAQVLLDACQDLTTRGFLIMDAMDETPHGKQRDDIIKLLHTLSTTSAKLSILVTSQNEPDFERNFDFDRGWLIVGLSRSRVNIDIETFIHHKLSTLMKSTDLNDKDRKYTEEYLIREADGSFQWVALIMEMLRFPRGLRRIDIDEILHSLPKGLEETYDRLFNDRNRINDSVAPDISRALRWLAFAKRPLYLEEVIEGSILNPTNPALMESNRLMKASHLLGCLSGLITVDPHLGNERPFQVEKHVMALAHSSVKSYLTRKAQTSTAERRYFFPAGQSNRYIAECCVEYYCRFSFVSWEKRIYALAKYSKQYWKQHAEDEPRLRDRLQDKVDAILTPILSPKQGSTSRLLEDRPSSANDNTMLEFVSKELVTNSSIDLPKITANITLQYFPLHANNFRVIVLLPSSSWDDPLECRLEVVAAEKAPHYRALSYTWGDQSVTGEVIIDGYTMKITSNLASALRHLRRIRRGVNPVLWVDAICINQSDDQERNHQVRMMSKIYESASCVDLWLGESTPDSDVAMEYLQRLEDVPDTPRAMLNAILSAPFTTWVKLYHIFHRQILERAWSLPESVVAKDIEVVCGLKCCSWSVLERVEKVYTSHSCEIYEYAFSFLGPQLELGQMDELYNETLPHINSNDLSQGIFGSMLLSTVLAIRRRFRSNHSFNILELLVLTKDYRCTDPRDRIYSLLMMLKNKEGLPEPDYQRSAEEVYLYFMRYILLQTKDIKLFSFVEPRSDNKYGPILPTWVPDWLGQISQSFDASFLSKPYEVQSHSLYNASPETTAKFELSEDSRSLTLSAVHVGSVAKINALGGETPTSSTLRGNQLQNMMRDEILRWMAYMDASAVVNRYGHSNLDDVFWRTFSADQDIRRFGHSKRLGKTGYSPLPDKTQIIDYWKKAAPRFLDNRTFFVSEEGYVGLCSCMVVPGDEIVVFLGSRMPSIIRAVGKEHKFMGEAYVHGIMDGELFKTKRTFSHFFRSDKVESTSITSITLI